MTFWAELPLKKGGLFGAAETDFQTDDRAAEEAEISRRDFVSVQPNPHLDEIFAEQGFGRLIDVYDKGGTERHDALLPCLMRREHGALGWCRVSDRAHQ